MRLERDKALQLKIAGGSCGVIRSTDLGRSKTDLTIACDSSALLTSIAGDFFEGNVDGKCSPDDHVSFFEFGHELATHERKDRYRTNREQGERTHSRPAKLEAQ